MFRTQSASIFRSNLFTNKLLLKMDADCVRNM